MTRTPPRTDVFDRQWHLFNDDPRSGVDLNLRDVWEDYTGRGVSVGVWDTGIDYGHWDLAPNYDASKHIRVDGRTHDPEARDGHGTAVAGLIAAADNGRGGTGVAPEASLTGVAQFVRGGVNPGESLPSLMAFDVTNHSWGHVEAWRYDALRPAWAEQFGAEFERSVAEGRDGLGTINVFSATNAREWGHNSNVSGLTSAPTTIAVGAVGHDGRVSFYSTPGPTLLVSAPSDDEFGDPAIWTTDIRGARGYSPGWDEGSNRNPDVTSAFGGTSAAAPMVSGVVALMLEANPDLGWRDVQEILALSARHVGSAVGREPRGPEVRPWFFNGAETWNGGGLHYSVDYGFGLADAFAAVRLAESWTLSQTNENRLVETAATWTGSETIRGERNPLRIELEVASEIDVESVGLRLDLGRGEVGDHSVRLTSPSGTTVDVSAPVQGAPKSAWLFGAKAFWGEGSAGTWTVEIFDGGNDGSRGRLNDASLTFDGGAATDDDVYVFTEEFSDHAGTRGHGRRIGDAGGHDVLNAAAVRSDTVLNLRSGAGVIDGERVALAGVFEGAVTGDGADRISGGGAGERLWGGRGGDALRGGAGDDLLSGRQGRDLLADGRGADVLAGGRGADVFRLRLDGETDRIRDFRPETDRIALEGLSFADLSVETLEPGRVRVAYGDETLIVEGGGRDALAARDLGPDDFLFG